jgi:hypothetical protein
MTARHRTVALTRLYVLRKGTCKRRYALHKHNGPCYTTVHATKRYVFLDGTVTKRYVLLNGIHKKGTRLLNNTKPNRSPTHGLISYLSLTSLTLDMVGQT